jgi:cbb3-type cytochrome oxidase subunit 3
VQARRARPWRVADGVARLGFPEVQNRNAMPKANRIIGRGQTLGAACVGLLGLAAAVHVYSTQRKASAAEAAAWSLDGPPCPVVTPATYAAVPGAPKATTFEDASFEYRVGHMMCVHRPDARGWGEHPVCQFTGPVLLGVKVPGTQAFFAPPSMSAARVGVVDGKIGCVLIPPFKMGDRR